MGDSADRQISYMFLLIKRGDVMADNLDDMMEIREFLMSAMEKNSKYKSEGSGAGEKEADFSFSWAGKSSSWVAIEKR